MKSIKQSIVTSTTAVVLALSLGLTSTSAIAQGQQQEDIWARWAELAAVGIGMIVLGSLFEGEATSTGDYGSRRYTDYPTNSYGSQSGYTETDYSGEYGCAWGSRDYGTCH
jgi:hypothetical protein